VNLTEYNDYIAYSRQHFEEGLIRAGFMESNAGWRGPIAHSGGVTEVLITLRSRFPFQPPRVVPVELDLVPWSWHRELDGALCLVAEDDHDGLWWTEGSEFVKHITAWFEQADASWPDDRPDLDLDRYFDLSEDTRVYLYEDLEQHRNGFVRFRPAKNDVMRIGTGTRPAKASKHSKDRFAYVADLGEVAVPPRTWDDIAALIDPTVDLDRRIRDHAVAVLVLIYRRGAHDGAIALSVWPTKAGGIAIRRLRSGADSNEARQARAGVLAPTLRDYRVAIIGVGALGSFVADTLVRSGIRNLTLVDADVVMPGNLVRHLVGPEAVGLPKGKAVKDHLVARTEIAAADIEVVNDRLTSGDEAVELLRTHDLLINTTADFSTTALLHVTAQSLGTRVLSAALQNDGATYRIDVLPPLDGATPHPPSALDVNQTGVETFEAGCGSPISPTPPYAVIEAAAATVRHAIGLLVDRPLHPAGEVRNIPTNPEGHQL
jgi:molybdopterin/thiamine biosynthesis adenylyltransferase